jgi:hypothetical protein
MYMYIHTRTLCVHEHSHIYDRFTASGDGELGNIYI